MSRDTFALPDLGEGLTEGQLVRWLVAVGDTVAVDAPIAEVETAKAIVEIPTPYAGVVVELHCAEGATVPVGEPLVSVEAPAESGAAPESPSAAAYVEEERAGSGNVLVGYGAPPTAGTGRRRRRARHGADSANGSPADGSGAVVERPRTKSPLVRRRARELGVDLAAVRGSGAGGLITRADVEAAAATADQRSEESVTTPAEKVVDRSSDDRTGLPVLERIPLRGVRRTIATAMSRSRQEIPEATVWVDLDATALLELRETLRTPDDPGPGVLALVGRFTVAALAAHPMLNARLDTDAEEIVTFDGVHLGVATQTERGLVVPTVRNAHRLGARGLDAELRRVVTAAREGTATPTDLGSSSFTINNYGTFGVDGSAAIINHPEVAILGIGRIARRPWEFEGELALRQVVQLSLAFDHRVCDGAEAAGFLRQVADAIESPIAGLAS